MPVNPTMEWTLSDMEEFNSGSTRSTEPLEDPEGFLSPFVINYFNEYMAKHRTQADGEIRTGDNWQKGMPKARYMRSMWRHFLEVWTIWRNPRASSLKLLIDPLCALMFNVHGMLLEVIISLEYVQRPIIRSEDDVSK